MGRFYKVIGVMGLLLAAGLYGCNSPEPETTPSDEGGTAQPATGTQPEEQPAEGESEAAAEPEETDAAAANLAKLSDEDRAAAEKQKNCPVSGQALGGMGVPVKVAVKDKDGNEHQVFLCCDHCKESIEKEPDKYLAKLNP